jgi:SAM-dependent methyltransferase
MGHRMLRVLARLPMRIREAFALVLLPRFFPDQWKQAQSVEQEDGFDEKYGTETRQIMPWHNYVPTPVRTFQRILRGLPAGNQFCFIDLGSGCGRVVLMAMNHFHQVIGVEISEELHQKAEQNTRQFQTITRIQQAPELVCKDAQDFIANGWPDKDVVVFMYAPFHPPALRKIVASILQTHSPNRELYLIHVNIVGGLGTVLDSFFELKLVDWYKEEHPVLGIFNSYSIFHREAVPKKASSDE